MYNFKTGLAQVCIGSVDVPEELKDTYSISDEDDDNPPTIDGAIQKKLDFMFRIYDLDR